MPHARIALCPISGGYVHPSYDSGALIKRIEDRATYLSGELSSIQPPLRPPKLQLQLFNLLRNEYVDFLRFSLPELRSNADRSEILEQVDILAALLEGIRIDFRTLPVDSKRVATQAQLVVQFMSAITILGDKSREIALRLDQLNHQFNYILAGMNLSESAAALAEIEDVVDKVKEAAGVTADVKLGAYYDGVAQDELRDARNFRRLAMVCFVLGIAVAIWIAWSIVNDHQEGAASQLFKLAVTIPILGAAFYLAHEANSHRMVARRAKEVEIRLQTLDAFLAPLSPEQRESLRARVGESILSSPLNLSAGTDKQAIDAQAIIEKLIDKAG